MKAPSPSYRPAHSMTHRPAHALEGSTAWAMSYKPKHAMSRRSSFGVFQRPALAIAIAAATVTGMVATPAVSGIAAAATTPQTLDLNVLLIGGVGGATDPTTAAWESALTTEGVPYTEVDAAGTSPSETVSLPTLSSGTTGNFNGIVIADSPTDFASGQLNALYSYETTFRVNQIDGYMYPSPSLGGTWVGATDTTYSTCEDGTTGALTSAGLGLFPELKLAHTLPRGSHRDHRRPNAWMPNHGLRVDNHSGCPIHASHRRRFEQRPRGHLSARCH